MPLPALSMPSHSFAHTVLESAVSALVNCAYSCALPSSRCRSVSLLPGSSSTAQPSGSEALRPPWILVTVESLSVSVNEIELGARRPIPPWSPAPSGGYARRSRRRQERERVAAQPLNPMWSSKAFMFSRK